MEDQVTPYVTGEEVIIGAEALDAILGLLTNIDGNTQDDPVSIISDPTVVTYDLLVPPDRMTGLATTMEDIFGTYTPLTYHVTTVSGDTTTVSTEVVPGLAGLDWSYIGGVTLFAIMLYCLFRLIGVVLK